jgi:uncharacterized membrane protein
MLGRAALVAMRILPEKAMHPLARLLLGLAAGLLSVLLIDRFLWPGTFWNGAIGVVVAVIVLGLFGRRDSAV